MKNINKYLTVAALGMLSMNTIAQEKAVVNREVKNEVKEEIRIEEVNGEKTVYVTKRGGGVCTTEVYKGEEAIAKEKEFETRGTPTNQPKPINPSVKKVEVRKVEKN